MDEGNTSKTCSLCGEIHENGRIERGLFKCPHTGKVINADLNGAINILHIPESIKDRGKWLKAQPVVYRWINGAGWVTTSYEAMKMKAVNHEPMIRLEGTIAFKAVRMSVMNALVWLVGLIAATAWLIWGYETGKGVSIGIASGEA